MGIHLCTADTFAPSLLCVIPQLGRGSVFEVNRARYKCLENSAGLTAPAKGHRVSRSPHFNRQVL